MSPSATPIKRRKAFFFFLYQLLPRESVCLPKVFTVVELFLFSQKKRNVWWPYMRLQVHQSMLVSTVSEREKRIFQPQKHQSGNRQLSKGIPARNNAITSYWKEKNPYKWDTPPEHTRIACKQAHTSRRFNWIFIHLSAFESNSLEKKMEIKRGVFIDTPHVYLSRALTFPQHYFPLSPAILMLPLF